MITVYLSLGSNIGDKKNYLNQALASLNDLPATKVVKVSSFYQTTAWGNTNQDNFLNITCQLETMLEPQALLSYCQQIEKDLDRIRHEHWGPRTIDIDILLYGDDHINEINLKIPHPYMTQRAFVMVPLEEIAPDLVIEKKHLSDYLEKLDTSEVVKVLI